MHTVQDAGSQLVRQVRNCGGIGSTVQIHRLYCTGGRESILQTGAMHFLSVGGREYTITQAVQEAGSLFYSILYILVYTVQGRRCGLWSREYVNSFIV